MQADVPMELLNADKMKHSEIWKVLKANGWTWINGRGLITHVYLRPNRSEKPPNVQGIDYFNSLDSLTDFVKKIVKANRLSPHKEEPSSSSSSSRVQKVLNSMEEEAEFDANVNHLRNVSESASPQGSANAGKTISFEVTRTI